MNKAPTLEDRVDHLRNKVLNYPLIENIDKSLVLLAIVEPNSQLYHTTKKESANKYHAVNNDRLEFLGDAVLELLISDMLYKKGIETAGRLSVIRSVIVRNVSLICLMNDQNLCDVTKKIEKNCADMFEAIVGAVYVHLDQYDNINPIKIMIKWLIDIWNIDNIIEDILKHPNDENICQAVQRSYHDSILPLRPYFDYIKDDYQRLAKIYEYYKLGQIDMKQSYDNKTRLWNIKISCPMALGCQFYEDRRGDSKYIANQSNKDKKIAIARASEQAIDVILNDYQLL